MGKTTIKMENQYGKRTKTRFNSTILKGIDKFGISRVNYSLDLMKKYKKEKGNRLLDIGCGNGEFCTKNRGKFKEIFGLDVSPSRIIECKKSYIADDINFIVHDMNNKLEFEDGYFDVINSLVTFEWIYDLNGALEEVYRILEDDGIFILEVNNLGFIYRRLKLLFGYYPETCGFAESERKNIGWDGATCHMFTKSELSRFLKEFGFEVLEVTGTGMFYKLRNWCPSLLCGDLFYVLKKKK